MKLQNITAERRTGHFDDGRPYDTWAVFLSFHDGAAWKQFAFFLPPDCTMDATAGHLANAAKKLLGTEDAKSGP